MATYSSSAALELQQERLTLLFPSDIIAAVRLHTSGALGTHDVGLQRAP